jgi:hypothetical protein
MVSLNGLLRAEDRSVSSSAMGMRGWLAMLSVAVVALAASATALAAAEEASPRASSSGKPWSCSTARFRLKNLERNLRPHFEEKIARVEADLASRTLTAAKARNGQRFLAHLRTRVDKISARIAWLAAKVASCGQAH